MKIKMTGVQYILDDNGDTMQVMVTYQGYEGSENFNASVHVTGDKLDDMSKADFDKVARQKMMEWTTVEPAK